LTKLSFNCKDGYQNILSINTNITDQKLENDANGFENQFISYQEVLAALPTIESLDGF
jgi:hypothetical protein